MTVTTPLTDNRERPELTEIDGAWYYRHGTGGGLVAITARVAPSAYIDRTAMVKNLAVVGSNARLFHHSVVEDQALVLGMSTLRGNARIGGRAVVRNITMTDDTYVGGNASVDGAIRMEQCARIVDVEIRGSFRFC